MSEVIVFVGPTLSSDEVQSLLPGAMVRPPVALGDVFRSLQHRPDALVIIDGLFERVPAVWHKELLWAIDQGVSVYGASSMGALRAAELAPFGMVGVGEIFNMLTDGRLEDDDEVTVAHLGADEAFRAVSEAMVNIRATTDAGVVAGFLAPSEATAICTAAKARFYPDRGWTEVLYELTKSGLLTVQRSAAIREWVFGGGRVDLKANDARALLAHVAERLAEARPVRRPSWNFEHTTFWELAMHELTTERSDMSSVDLGSVAERVVDELRLDPDEYRAIHDEAFVRWLATAYANARSLDLRPEETQAVLDSLRLELGLHEPEDVERWLEEQEMTLPDLRTLVREEAFLAWARSLTRRELNPIVIDVLRRRQRYGDLAARARAKRDDLRLRGLDGSPTGDGVDDDTVLDWWFNQIPGQPRPDDLVEYLFQHGHSDRSAFIRAVRREFWYRRSEAKTP